MTLRRTRIGTTPDMLRVSAAVERPGIDPRIWISIGYAVGESKLDAEHGDFVEVVLLPSQLELTCRVPQDYAGAQFGSNAGRIHKDDEVLVLIPDGDPAHGGTVIARYWSASDKPPALATSNPKDWVLELEKDLNWRTKLNGAGKAYLEAETTTLQTGKVRLGAEDATEAVILGTSYRNAQAQLDTQVNAALAQLTSAGAQMAAAAPLLMIPVAGPIMASPLFLAASTFITAAAAQMTTAFTQFETALSAINNGLSAVSKTK